MPRDWVDGKGNKFAKVMVIGESPGKYELNYDQPIAGPLRQELNTALSRIGVYQEDVYITNFVKYPLADNKKLTEGEHEFFKVRVEEEVRDIQPEIILTLGDIASHVWIDKRYDMESINAVPHKGLYDTLVIPTYHFTSTLNDPAKYNWIWGAFRSLDECVKYPTKGIRRANANGKKEKSEKMVS